MKKKRISYASGERRKDRGMARYASGEGRRDKYACWRKGRRDVHACWMEGHGGLSLVACRPIGLTRAWAWSAGLLSLGLLGPDLG